MEEEKWWQDTRTRQEMVDTIVGKRFPDKSELTLGTFKELFRGLSGNDFKAEDLQDAIIAYSTILLSNFVFNDERLNKSFKDFVDKAREQGKEVGLKNSKLYGASVAKLATGLAKIGFKTKTQVEDFLPELYSKCTTFLTQGDVMNQLIPEIQKSFILEFGFLASEYFGPENKVDSALDELE